ncbi:unnamed protein product [Lactuca saligna]|uniref:Cupin type-1 domain-containing protein n=1 Tax=Lactuca saligna TaxID=75948 RepID=A0AA35ZD40_LACSI|nr:unnamed protein product [Lactuca saligna]
MGKGSSKVWVFLLLAVVVSNALVIGVYGQGKSRWEGDAGEETRRGRREVPPESQRGRGGGGSREMPPEEEAGRGGAGGGGGSRRGRMDSRRFILQDAKRVVATDAGGMRVVKGVGGKLTESPMHIGFITMEPNSMFIPQYLDSSLIIFVELGEARIGSIYQDDFVEKDLKSGDLYRIQAGSAFYIVNNAEGQRLHIITSIDTSESSDWSAFQSFYIGGGANPSSVLAGFDIQTLSTALNVSFNTVDELLSSRQKGAIVYLKPDSESEKEPSIWKRFLDQGNREKQTQMKRIVQVRVKNDEGEKTTWSLTEFVNSMFGVNKKKGDSKSLDSYNIYDRKPDFKNDYGWSIEVNENDYEPLKKSDFGVYLVNLTAGSMMAPHINPTAIEYGVVLSGTGNIQVVFPNGTLAMNAEVNEGDVFWIPRYFPFCQVASRSNPFVFFGFSTSARNNRPQFLVGQGSLLQTMMGPEFATAFGMSEERLKEISDAQKETTILPAASASPGGGDEEIPEGEGGGGGSQEEEGGGRSTESVVEKMGSKIRMKKNSFAYNMAMELE